MIGGPVDGGDASNRTRRGDVDETKIGEVRDALAGSAMDVALLRRQHRESQRLHRLGPVHGRSPHRNEDPRYIRTNLAIGAAILKLSATSSSSRPSSGNPARSATLMR